ncbi:MAG: hypothetical protein ACMUHX_04630 [bacterium]
MPLPELDYHLLAISKPKKYLVAKGHFMKLPKKIFFLVTLFIFLFFHILYCVSLDNVDIFYQKLSTLCWICYAPTNFDPREKIYPSESSIQEDLALLKKTGFNGLVTFGAEESLGHIPRIAKKAGFQGVIMGIWLPNSLDEFRHAIAAKDYVDAYCVGHLGLNKYYNISILQGRIEKLKDITKKPVSTSECIEEYFKNRELVDIGDWLFPDAHLYWDIQEKRTPEKFFHKLIEDYRRLDGISKKPVLIKTIGYPSGGNSDATEENQAELFQLILENAKHPYERVRFVYFEAFDQQWKTWHPIEAHWGIFKSDRTPKKGSNYIGKSVIIKIPHTKDETKDYWIKILNSRGMIISVIAIIVIFFIIIFYITKDDHEHVGIILRLLTESKNLICIKNGTESELHFNSNPNECFDILLLLCTHIDKPMFCGEIIHLVKQEALTSNCSFGEQDKCDQKKEWCKSYKILNNHRIGVIRKMLTENKIGYIENIKRQSKWRMILNPEVKVEIITETK